MDEKNFSLEDLVEKGKNGGSISNEDLLDAISSYQDFDMDQIDKIYETLESNGIEITDELTSDKFADLESEVEQMISSEEIEVDVNPSTVLRTLKRACDCRILSNTMCHCSP